MTCLHNDIASSQWKVLIYILVLLNFYMHDTASKLWPCLCFRLSVRHKLVLTRVVKQLKLIMLIMTRMTPLLLLLAISVLWKPIRESTSCMPYNSHPGYSIR